MSLRPRTGWRTSGAAVLLAAASSLVLVVSAGPASAKPDADVLLDGLSSPKGVTIAPNQNPVVAQGAFGAPGPVLEYQLRSGHGTTQALTDPAGVNDVAATADGGGWALTSERPIFLLRAAPDGEISAVLNITAYQRAHPDPNDQDGDAKGSNPYGLAAVPNGDALVSDAQHNDLLRVTESGDVTLVARFLPEMIGGINAEAVPTTVTIGPDGAAYVGELKGFPFEVGSSRIWRVEPDATGAECSSAGSSGGCSQFASGFTAIQDIAFNNNNGVMYVYELAADGVLAFEEGLGTGVFPAAVLLKVHNGRQTELVPDQLSQPGGVAVARNGTVFVTDSVFTGGRLLRVRG